MKQEKQAIGCTVDDCKHQDADACCCNLTEIKVCHCNDGTEKEATMCDNYELGE